MDDLADLIIELLAADVADHAMNGDPCECDEPFNVCDYHSGYFAGAHALLNTFTFETETEEQ